MPGGHLIWVRAPQIAEEARPGQYVMVRCGQGPDPLLRRPLSIHRLGQQGRALALLFAVVGRGTSWLAQRKEGDVLDLIGPLGKGFEIESSASNLLLVGGGRGVAPLVALAEHALAQSKPVTLLLGAESSPSLYPGDLLPPGLEVALATEDGSVGRKGVITDLLPDYMGGADQIFACGPIPMYKSMLALSRKRIFKGKSVQIVLEQLLGCGVGACYGCTVPTKHGPKLVCKDGPVFELREVLWDEVREPVGREVS